MARPTKSGDAVGSIGTTMAPRRRIPQKHATHSAEFRPQSRTQSPDRKSTRLNSSHLVISYAVFCLKKKKKTQATKPHRLTTKTTHYNIKSASYIRPARLSRRCA